MVHDRGDVPSDFHGDNFLGCTVGVTVAEHNVDMSVEVFNNEDGPGHAEFKWRPTGPPVNVTVRSGCEPAYEKGYVSDVTDDFRRGGSQSFTDHELTQRMLARGIPNEGVYHDPEPSEYDRWMLTLGPGTPEEVRVAIEGPTCACLEAEVAAPKVVDFAARASVSGGTFAKWVVTPEGAAPRELVNSGGAAGALSLGLTPETRRVALSITYTRNGKTYRSDPHTVAVCATDSLSTADGVKDFTFDAGNPGRAILELRTRATVAGRDVSREIRWTMERTDDLTTLSPLEATGAEASFTYDKLPSRNSSFGPKRVTMQVQADGCDCTRTETVRLFFAPLATNHPGITELEGAANFFYYWLQSAAAEGLDKSVFRYRDVLADVNGSVGAVIGRFVPADGRVYVSRALLSAGCRGAPRAGTRTPGPGNTGIDCFAETLRHELQHRTDYQTWWPNGYADPSVSTAWDLIPTLVSALANDADGDKVPASVEASLAGCRDAFSTSEAERARNIRSCTQRPFDDVLDLEINAYYAGWKWQRGRADKEDWSCGGKQWRGKSCPTP